MTGVRARSLLCADCGKAVCPKCGLETSTLPPGVSGQAITGATNTSLTSSHKVMMATRRQRINEASDVLRRRPGSARSVLRAGSCGKSPELGSSKECPRLRRSRRRCSRPSRARATRRSGGSPCTSPRGNTISCLQSNSISGYRVEREHEEQVDNEAEESSEDEAAGELAKRGLSKLGSENNRSESDLSGTGLSQVSNFSSMESLNTLDAARRLSDVGPYHYVHPHGHHNGHHSPRGFPGGYRGRPLGPRPFPPGMSGPRPPWPAGRGSPRPRPPHFSPRGSPRGHHYPRGRYPSPRGGRPSRPLSCPPKGPSSTASSPLGSVVTEQPPMASSQGPASLSVESPSPSDNELTEVPFSPVTTDGKSKNGKGRSTKLNLKIYLFSVLIFHLIRPLNTRCQVS